jgi:signal transduction histidine kinase
VRFGIAFRINVIVLATVLALGGLLGAFFVAEQERAMERDLERRFALLGASLTGSVAAAMEQGDSDDLARTLEDTAGAPEVVYAIVKSPEGEVVAARWGRSTGAVAERRFPLRAARPGAREEGPRELFGAATARGGGPLGELSIGVDLAPSLEARRSLRVRTIVAVLAAALAAALLGFRAVRRLVRTSVAPLVDGIRRIGAGELPPGIELPPRKDEIGEIGSAFNDMLGRLSRTLVSEKQLEAVVAERTGELERALAAQRRLQEQYLQAQKLESVGRLAGGVAHDFNNLLVAILGNCEVLEEGIRTGDPSLEDLAEIRSAGERARDLVRQLLAVARRQMVEPHVLDLNEVLRDAERLLRRVLGEDVDVAVHPAEGLWPVRADPSQLHQVLLNLAVNARDAMPQGGKLTLETSNVELDETYVAAHEGVRPGPHVVLAVSDSGQGLSPEARAHLFEPFFTTKPAGAGTGLGLATVYGIVKQAGGHVWVYSEPGRGTTFKIYLPCDSGVAEAREPLEPAAGPRTQSGTETVLVVEDDPMVRGLAVRALAAAGYRVLEAARGPGALELAATEAAPIHLLVTDVVMPDMSGPQLAEALRASRPDVRVLYMSGYTENTVVHRGVLDPGVQLLSKPFTPSELQEKVRQVLDAAGRSG